MQRNTFSGAAGGAAERFPWSFGWGSDDFSGFNLMMCVVAAGAQDTAGGAVVTAVGGAAEFTVGAADAVRIIHWGAAQWWQRRTFGGF